MLDKIESIRAKNAKRKFSSDFAVRKMMYEKLGSLVSNGMSIQQVVDTLLKRAAAKKNVESYFLFHLRETLGSGKDFSDALKEWASPNEVLIIASGEKSGKIAESFESCAALLEKLITMKKTIISASIYPGILMSALFLVIYGFSNFMIPILSQFSEKETWPTSAQDLADFSMSVSDNLVFIILAFAGFVWIVGKSMGILTGSIRDNILDKIPPYSLYREIQSGLLLVSISTLMKSGLSFNKTLDFIEEESPKYLQNKVAEITMNLQDGKNEGASMNTAFIGSIGDDIEDFSEGSSIEEALSRMGSQIVNDKIEKIQSSAGILKGIAMLLVFGYVLWAYSSFISITQNMNVN